MLGPLLVLALLAAAFVPTIEAVRPVAYQPPLCLWNPDVPARAYEVEQFARSHNFAAPPGLKGNKAFRNDNLDLPPWFGPFREYDLDPPPPAGGRPPERVVLGPEINWSWYSPDHYHTFIEMYPPQCINTANILDDVF